MRIIAVASLLSVALARGQHNGVHIRILEGEGAIHNVRGKRFVEPRIQVVDESGRAVAEAVVTFTLPGTGPGGSFREGKSLTVSIGSTGEATARGLRPNGFIGAWEIRVSATSLDRTARASIPQINAAPVEAFVEPKRRSKTWMILGVVAAGAAGGLAVGIGGGKGGGPPLAGNPPALARVPSATVTAGMSTFGAP